MKIHRFYLLVILGFAVQSLSQGVQVKTVPLLSCDQFALVPSFRDDMGGVSIALRDPLQDVFSNPGLFFAELHSQFFSTIKRDGRLYDFESTNRYSSGPSFSQVVTKASANSALWSLPVGFLLRAKNSYLGAMTGLQNVNSTSITSAKFKADNYPLSGLVGHYFSDIKTAMGVSVDYRKIHGIDGVYPLYPNAVTLSQNGYAAQYRVGLSGEWKGKNRWSLLAMRYLYHVQQTSAAVLNKDENNRWTIKSD